MKYTIKEKLEITESIVTIIMFFMAVWGSIISFEEGFWHKLNHIVNHYHQQLNIQESRTAHNLPVSAASKHQRGY